ncbi:MAG: hypothetical protein JXM73_25475 [Anaerolineae bacterium]|nr:hypothetical protein [Anaerolineae bacterium]
MNIPNIGVVRGLFDLFVPGAFLVLNVFIVIYAVLDSSAQDKLLALASNATLSLLVVICFGYLAGVIVRLFGTEVPDNWSARLIRLISRKTWREPHVPFKVRWSPKTTADEQRFELWAVERFPYVGWIGHTHTFGLEPQGSDKLEPIVKFHQQVWAVQRDKWQSKTFFDHCKTVLNSVDERASSEFYAVEALCRYLTGIFYSLLITLILVALGLIAQWALGRAHIDWVLFGAMFLIYLLMLWAVLRHYRIMRIKEAGIVFSATYHHRRLFEPPANRAPLSMRERLHHARVALTGHRSKS